MVVKKEWNMKEYKGSKHYSHCYWWKRTFQGEAVLNGEEISL